MTAQNSERALATVAVVAGLTPIAGADRIETARIRGWNVVVGKGQFKVGDKVVYFELDSALPLDDSRFEQFGARGKKTMPSGKLAHVLRTIKLRGQVSQGLVMSLAELGLPSDLPEGEDLTERLGITKWEPPLTGSGDAVGLFFTELADKTDSERVQNLSDAELAELAQHTWQATEKCDGTSVSIARTADGVRVCSRNLEVGPASLHHKAAMASGIASLLAEGQVAQGEIVGPGINSNRLQLTDTRILIFDVWDHRVLVPRDEWPSWAAERAVPVLEVEFPRTVDEAVAQANGLRSRVNPQVAAEGIVWHTTSGVQPVGGRSTLKVINNDYLLNS